MLHCCQITTTNYQLTASRWYGVCVRTWQITDDLSETLKIIASTHYLQIFTVPSSGLTRPIQYAVIRGGVLKLENETSFARSLCHS